MLAVNWGKVCIMNLWIKMLVGPKSECRLGQNGCVYTFSSTSNSKRIQGSFLGDIQTKKHMEGLHLLLTHGYVGVSTD